MKKLTNYKRIWLALLLLLTLAMLACGCTKDSGENPASGDNPAEIDDPGVPVESTVHVSDVESLLNAIEPGAEIELAPGYYNLSEFLDSFSTDDIIAWNGSHPYIQMMGKYDGLEVIIQNVDGLILRGGSENAAATEIVIDPRYCNVLTFSSCSDLELSQLTMGHTDRGSCQGSVVCLLGTQRARFYDVDLYGCGVYGIEARSGSGDIYVQGSTLRDCEYGPFEIYECTGTFDFTDCVFTGSLGMGYFDPEQPAGLNFKNCVFGYYESNWQYQEYPEFEDCTFDDREEGYVN